MATPAAILQIVVDANTKTATTALNKFDSKLRAVDKTSVSATTRTTALGKATQTAGTRLASAARWAAGAAAAYVSISQAKAAVTTTQDLAKVTAGLNRNLGLSSKRASQWGSVAKARDIDAKALTMSFTTLSRRITDASRGSEEAKKTFDDIGVSVRDLRDTQGSFNDQLLLVADAFGEAEGGALRQQAAQKLLGRGYQTLLPMFAEGSKSLREQMEWADRYGTTLDQKTVKQQMELVAAQRESKVAWMGLQVAFAKFLTPALEKANEQFQRIARIVGSDKLTNAEKFKKLGNIIERHFDAAFTFITETLLPKFIATMGERAPRIAAAMLEGFVKAPIWGKVFIGGWLIAKMGGRGFFTGQGKIAGRLFAGGLLLALPSLIGDAFDLGKKIGNAIKDALGVGENRPIEEGFGGRFLGQSVRGFHEADFLRRTEEDRAKLIEKARKESHRQQQAMERANALALTDITDWGAGRVLDKTKGGLGKQEAAFDNTHGKLRSTTANQARDVVANVDGMVNAVGAGLGVLGRNTNETLRAYGAKLLQFKIDTARNNPTGQSGFQTGGPIPGFGTGDKVPAMLEPGEFVMNRNATSRFGPLLARMNKAVPRFATGGAVGDVGGLTPAALQLAANLTNRFGGSIFSGLRPGDSGFHGRGMAIDWVGGNWSQASAYMNSIGASLLEGIYNPAVFGGSPVSWDSGARVASSFWGGDWAGHQDHIHAAVGAGANLKAVATQIARVMLQGPAGPLRDIGQGALDRVRKAANAYIARQMPTMVSHGNLGSVAGVMSKPQIMKLWSSANRFGDPNLMAAIALAESSGNPAAHGPPDGRGLWQIEWPVWGNFMSARGLTNAYDPFQNAKMAGHVLREQGLGAWVVFNTGDYLNFLKKGGEVLPYIGKYHNGGVAPQEGLAHVAKGERIGDPDITLVINGQLLTKYSIEDLFEAWIDGRKKDIADYTLRRGGRDAARYGQLGA